MSQHDDFDRMLARWFDDEAHPAAMADVLDRALLATRRRRPLPGLFAALGSHWVGGGSGPISGVATLGRTGLRTSMALLLLLLALALVAGAALVGARLLQPAPAVGQLVLNVQTWSPGFDAVFAELAVYADGRVIWMADERVGYVEQRLTPEGVERLRSKAISTGLFQRDGALGIDGVGWGNIKVRRGDRLVMVAWGQDPVNVSGLGLEDRFVRATSPQAVELNELKAFLGDPTAWGLPDKMYAQSEITPFVPSQLWVGYDRSRPNLSNLPSPTREVVTRILEPLFRNECENITIDQAWEIAQVLARAGIIAPDPDVRLGFAFDVPSPTSFVHVHPVLPHDVGTACGEV
jgi:hypothetical protein